MTTKHRRSIYIIIKRFLAPIMMAVGLITVFPVPASAATPSGLIAPGTYPINDYSLGTLRSSSSLNVTDSGGYEQSFNTGAGLLQLWPVMSTNTLTPNSIKLATLNVGGIYFYPDTNSYPVYEPIYRPYTAPDVLGTSGTNGHWTMVSTQAGGVNVDGSYVVVGPIVLNVAGQLLQVNELDMTLTFWGNGTGQITYRHFEVSGSSTDFRDDFNGDVTVLGTTSYINTSVAHGLLVS